MQADHAEHDEQRGTWRRFVSDPRRRRTRPVTLRTDANTYRAGARMVLTLENPTTKQYAFNPCNRVLEHESGGQWAVVDEGNRVCTMEAWLLQPRSSRSGATTLPGNLAAGRYRVALSLTVDGPTPTTPIRAESAPITITG